MRHAWSMTDLDEEEVEEVNRFKNALTLMCKAMGMGMLFTETARGNKYVRHMTMHCIPVKKEIEKDAPLYIQNEMMNVANEWQASNRKVIDTTKKGIINSVPKGFPYCHIEWSNITGPAGGYAHSIENENEFPRDFALDVISGMISGQGFNFNRKNKETTYEEQKKNVIKFIEKWEAFDWTTELDGGEYS